MEDTGSVPIMDANLAYYCGDAKALGGGRVGGYLVRFTGPTEPDLTGEFFTKDTEFGTNSQPPVLYHHGMDGRMKARIIGSSSLKFDDIGIWIEAQLDLRDEYEKAIYGTLVEGGKAGWSSGAGTVEVLPMGKVGWIKTWLIAEASITPIPAEPKNGVSPIKSLPNLESLLPEDSTDEASEGPLQVEEAPAAIEEQPSEPQSKHTAMDEAQKAAFDEMVARLETRLAAAEKALATQDTPEMGRSVKSAPAVITDTSHWKYDNASAADLSFAIEFLGNTEKARKPSDGLIKALAMRLESNDASVDVHAKQAYKAFAARNGVKANEIMQSTLASYGDEWAGVAYSSELWNLVRSNTQVLAKIPQYEFPVGAESYKFPLESTDPTWYLVAQSASLSANPGGIPTNTVTSSTMGTANQTATLSKIGARTLYTGELSEDSVIAVAPQILAQFAISGAESLESAIIDGDTATGATTNINDIGGTPAGSEYWLAFNGFRKVPLVTNTANSRPGGTLTSSDFLETAKLLGVAGQYAEPGKASFIVDANTYWKALELDDVKTRDVFSPATLENGRLTGIYGFDVMQSFHMHKASSVRKANTAGKVDRTTVGNNTTGSLLMVRWDHWKFGFRRRMTLETTRIAAADATEIVAMMRGALTYRDTDASSVTYNISL